jgi:hypothetical protein
LELEWGIKNPVFTNVRTFDFHKKWTQKEFAQKTIFEEKSFHLLVIGLSKFYEPTSKNDENLSKSLLPNEH